MGDPQPTTQRLAVPHSELARLSRLQWQAESRSAVLREEQRLLAERAESAETRAHEAQRHLRQVLESPSYRLARAIARIPRLVRPRRRGGS